jgi:hypothetical protein
LFIILLKLPYEMRGYQKLGILGIIFASSLNGCYNNNPIYNNKENTSIKSDILDKKPLIIGFEGMQPLSLTKVRDLTKEIAKKNNLEYSVSDLDYETSIKEIEKTHNNNQKIIILGYSQGANKARLLAEQCKYKNIEIDLLIYLDPTYTRFPDRDLNKIPKNVKKVVCYRHQENIKDISNFDRGKELQESDFEDPNTIFNNRIIWGVDHLQLPSLEIKELKDLLIQDINDVFNEKSR